MYEFKLLGTPDIAAPTLILSMMSVSTTKPMTISQMVEGGRLFGIEPATTRVAATRLLKEGKLNSVERGVYVPGPSAKALIDRVSHWQDVNKKVSAWAGDWIAVHTGHLGRTDRKRLRSCLRALSLNGYAEVYSGFSLRPNNLSASLNEHRDSLLAIGMDESAIVARIAEVSLPQGLELETLWSRDELKRSYQKALEAMRQSLEKLPAMTTSEAARETLLVGESVIKTINFDPLLPDAIGETELFQNMIDEMARYNQTGMEFWNQYWQEGFPS